MECVSTACTCIGVVINLWTSFGGWFNYHEILHSSMGTLRSEMEKLTSLETDINTACTSIEYGKKKRSEVENWLRNVHHQTNEVRTTEQKAGKRRYLGRSRFLRRVDRNIDEIRKLLDQGRFPDGFFIDVRDYKEEELPASPIVGSTNNLEKIWQLLMNNEISCIGVQGTGGVGKTTTVIHIYNRLLKNNVVCDRVFWVTVSQQSSISKLQDAIAKQINLDLSEEDDERIRAAKLRNALSRMKFTVIFDDVWEAFPVDQVGIPVASGKGKLIITSRSGYVCQGMECQEVIKVKPLSEPEAWNLFLEKLGHHKVLAPQVEEIAKGIARECDGLPLAIIVLAGSMRGVNDIREWRNVLRELTEQAEGLEDMEIKVYKKLELSFDRLNHYELQHCFLYCALYPEDDKIDRTDLIVHWIAEGLIKEVKSRKAEYDKGHAILNKLENACLLESAGHDDSGQPHVRMHDVIRDMALRITRERGNGDGPSVFKVKAGVGLEQLPDETEWSQNLGRVSLRSNKLKTVSISPKCPNLTTLFLQYNSNIREIQNSFFEHMQSLQVLDLSYCSSIKRLPDSITNLKNLRGLFLQNCSDLEYVPSLAELKELRELDLSSTAIRAIPEGLKGLVHLLRLDMHNTEDLESIPSGVLSNLSHLQSVRLDGTSAVIDQVQLKELISLRQLEMLGVVFSNLQLFTDFVTDEHWLRLTHYSLQIGESRLTQFSNGRLYCRQVAFINSHIHNNATVPTNVQELLTVDCYLPKSLSDVFISPSLKNGFRDLERGEIYNCEGIEHIWTITASNPNSSEWPNLKALMLFNLPDLTELFKFKRVGATVGGGPSRLRAPPKSGTAYSLNNLAISHCPKLKHLFTIGLLRHCLQNLQRIHVEYCTKMEDLITPDDNEEQEGIIIDERNSINITLFPNLRTLYLKGVRKLKSICRIRGTDSTQTTIMAFPSLQEITVCNCPMLKSLPFSVHQLDNDGVGVGFENPSPNPPTTSMTPSLKFIRGQRYWWNSLEWDPPHTKSDLEPLFSEDIKICQIEDLLREDKKRYEHVL